mmetsp:Transcript_92189/g.274983  ORF Transcript_92189/g.274983 Transcript_92189/m.274983 type:complete len:394 (-) Transcript_92189:571-1752(-)
MVDELVKHRPEGVLPDPDPHLRATTSSEPPLGLLEAEQPSVVQGEQRGSLLDNVQNQLGMVEGVLRIARDRVDQALQGPPVFERVLALTLCETELVAPNLANFADSHVGTHNTAQLFCLQRRDPVAWLVVQHLVGKLCELFSLLALRRPVEAFDARQHVLDRAAQRIDVGLPAPPLPPAALAELRGRVLQRAEVGRRRAWGALRRLAGDPTVLGRLEVDEARQRALRVPEPVPGFEVPVHVAAGVDIGDRLDHRVDDVEDGGHEVRAASRLRLPESVRHPGGPPPDPGREVGLVAVKVEEPAVLLEVQEGAPNGHYQRVLELDMDHDLPQETAAAAMVVQVKHLEHAWRVAVLRCQHAVARLWTRKALHLLHVMLVMRQLALRGEDLQDPGLV